jgi:hypothetical protein
MVIIMADLKADASKADASKADASVCKIYTELEKRKPNASN